MLYNIYKQPLVGLCLFSSCFPGPKLRALTVNGTPVTDLAPVPGSAKGGSSVEAQTNQLCSM